MKQFFYTASILFSGVSLLWADYKTDVGWTNTLPDGTGVKVSVVEADIDATPGGRYMPSAITYPDLAGRTFNNITNTSNATSWHSGAVGQRLYGNNSMSPGINTIDMYRANDWAITKLGTGTGFAPYIESSDIINHSWIGTTGSAPADAEIVRRFDYLINRDNVLAVIGLNNGNATVVPNLMAHSYNGLVVGLTSGAHSTGATTMASEVPGRVRPDIVAPEDLTSFSTPFVGSAAAIIIGKAKSTPALANAEQVEATKAILLAGATKTEFPSWDRTTTRPLDEHFGAGELNIANSYAILSAGEQAASNVSNVALQGWDFATITGATSLLYYFVVPAGNVLTELSAILSWNRQIDNSLNATLSNLDVRLYQATAFTLGSQLDLSASTVDNVEHIYQTNLSAGQYALEIRKNNGAEDDADLGFAWRASTSPVPEPCSAVFLIVGSALLLIRRRY